MNTHSHGVSHISDGQPALKIFINKAQQILRQRRA